MRVYLAGPMEVGETWRTEVTDRLGRLGIQTEVPEFLSTYTGAFGVSEEQAARILTDRDKAFATGCDAVLANFGDAPRRSLGTAVELGWASASGTTIISVIPLGCAHDHPILKCVSDYVVGNVDAAVRILASLAWQNSAGAWR